MTKRKGYKRYSPEFKREALKRASEEGVTDEPVGRLSKILLTKKKQT